MDREGPILESLTHRLAETPEDFLAEPRIGRTGIVQVAAVVVDLLPILGAAPEPFPFERFTGSDIRADRNRLAATLLFCWLLADDWFRQAKLPAADVLRVLDTDAAELAQVPSK